MSYIPFLKRIRYFGRIKRVKLIKSKLHFGLVENVFQISMHSSLMHFSLLLFFLVSHINAPRKNYCHMLHGIFCTSKFYIICSSNVARYQYTMFPRHLITAHHLIEFIYTTLTYKYEISI